MKWLKSWKGIGKSAHMVATIAASGNDGSCGILQTLPAATEQGFEVVT